MFLKSSDHDTHVDLSSALRDRQDWNVASLRTFNYLSDVSALAYDPVVSLLAIGTSQGIIALFGSPGVQCQVSLREPIAIKFLEFATSLHRLVCLDANNQLHVWDLESLLQNLPKHLGSAKFDEASALTVSPSHSHAFITLQSGVIRTYDLLCLRKSPYNTPNLWSLYEEKVIASGIPGTNTPDSSFGIDTLVHPRNLNLLFVVYGGGVVLSDLAERNTLRVYELILPPGAPGGVGYASKDLLTHRRPSVMAMAIHPSGHIFAAGYSDGSIAFWAVEDEDQPLMVRTLDDLDVNVVDGEKLDQYLPKDGLPRTTAGHQNSIREPIYKLSWSGFPNSSDPRGGATTLSILGGNIVTDAPGLMVHWLPPFNPPEPPSPTTNRPDQIPAFFRNAMRHSIIPTKTYFYATNTIVQDYLLVPRDNPHFGGAFDPISLLLLCEGTGGARIVEGRQFPPPSFAHNEIENASRTDNQVLNSETSPGDIIDDLTETLRSMQMEAEPAEMTLPLALEHGRSLMDGKLMTLNREAHQALVTHSDTLHGQLPLEGGIAWVDETNATELKHAKYHPHRLLVTQHSDLTVQFDDISAQLLMGSTEGRVENHFPSALTHLKIDLKAVLTDPSLSGHPHSSIAPRIDSASITSESLECAIALRSGGLFVYRPKPDHHTTPLFRSSEDNDLVILSHIPTQSSAKFYPSFLLAPGNAPLSAYAICDIGFLATAYTDGSLYIVDMRGPTVILRHDPNARLKSRHSIGLALTRHGSSTYPVGSLTWSVCTISTDQNFRVRLIAVRTTGATEIFTLGRSSIGVWSCNPPDPIVADSVDDPIPNGSFVIDPKTGTVIGATSSRLAASQVSTTRSTGCLWVISGAKSAKCIVDVTGDQIGKVRWNTKTGSVNDVQIVERNGSRALVAMTGSHTVYIHSLPELEQLHTLLLPSTRISALTMDATGDFIQWQRNPKTNTVISATYGTLFNLRRTPGLPILELIATKGDIPSTPQPVSMGPPSLLGSWFSFAQGVTGDQVDLLLGGPDRPIPEPKTREGNPSTSGSSGYSAASIAASASSAQVGIYNRLQSALNERGQMLGDLQDRFNDLEQGSRDMVNQAKRLATEQTAKRWFMGFG